MPATTFASPARFLRASLVARACAVTLLVPWALAATELCAQQQTTTPAIADSPTAQTLFEDIRAQARENPAESARIARRLLDEYGARVIRIGPESDGVFASVADETERFLLANPAILQRFRDMESRAAERMLREDGPASTAARRRLTPSGLAATLALAERAIRADQCDEALALLTRVAKHPDLSGADAVAHAALEAMARNRVGDRAGADAALSRLAAVPGVDAAQVARARATAEHTQPLAVRRSARSPLASSAQGGNADESWREIWSLELDQSLFRRLYGGPQSVANPKSIERFRTEASNMTASPTVLGNRIYLSEGQRVRAVDADSRDELWMREIGSGGSGANDLVANGTVGDLSAIAVDDGVLITYEGHGYPGQRSATPRVWCLDPRDGSVRWSVVIDGAEGRADFAGLFPVGEPLLVSDVVVVAARKNTQRFEQVDWLLGLDRRDGHVRWSTSVAGAPGTRSGRRQSGLATDGAVVIDATPLGAVACVRGSDGMVEWLHRFPVPLRESRGIAQPWEAQSPVIAGDRVLVIAPDEQEIIALDRANGRLVEARPIGPGTAWETPAYLVHAVAANGAPIVLGVGSDVVAFDARDLSKRLWALSDAVGKITPARAGSASRQGVRGRVSIAGGHVLLPGVDDMLLVDLESGRVQSRIPSPQPANAVLMSDRIVAAGDESLRVLMPTERAESLLRARLAATPDDPGSALALLEIAAATSRASVALDAARTAQQSLARGKGNDAIRSTLVDRLIEFSAKFPESGDAAYAIVGSVSDSPVLRVRGELARGEFLRGAGRAREAAECWRTLAADSMLGALFTMNDGVGRRARIEALERLARLTARDAEIAASLEASAAEAVARLGGGAQRAADLATLVESHPRTRAVCDALAAATALAPADAERLLVSAIEDVLVPPARADLIDPLRADYAKRMAGSAGADRLASLDDRIGALLTASGVDRPELRKPMPKLPSVGREPAKGIDITARLMEATLFANETRARDLILGLEAGSLVRLSVADPKQQQWRLRLDDREPTLLWARERIVLSQTTATSGEGALIVDAASGVVVYASPKAQDLWPGDGANAPAVAIDEAAERPQPQVRPGGQQQLNGVPRSNMFLQSQCAVACDGESLVFVQHGHGDLARIGVMDAQPKPLIARKVLDQIGCESIQDGYLTVGGSESTPNEIRAVVRVFDAKTLEPKFRIEPVTASPVKWAFTTALGEVFIGTHAGIERWVVGPRGEMQPTFAATVTECRETDPSRTRLLGANIFCMDGWHHPTIAPIFAGVPKNYEFPDKAESREVREVFPVAGGLLLQADDRFVLLGPTGETIGMDANARSANLAFALPVEGALLQLAALNPDIDAGNIRGGIRCVVDRLLPMKGLRNDGGAFEFVTRDSRVTRALAVDGWLLFSTAQGTMAISMPAEAAPSAPAKDDAKDDAKDNVSEAPASAP